MAIIHKYSCGCIGIPIEGEERCLLLYACDQPSHFHQDDWYSFSFRTMSSEKTSTPLSDEKEKQLVKHIATLIHDGYKMQDLALAIRHIVDRKDQRRHLNL